MNQERRSFLRNTLLSTGILLVPPSIKSLASITAGNIYIPGNNRELMIWHTSNLQGALPDLLPTGNENLLLDAGDFTGHTGIEMVQAMNKVSYHVANVGSRELVNGQAGLAALIPYIQFALVNCNYRFTDKTLVREVVPYKIVYIGQLKIGVTGVGPQLPAASGVTCLPPVEAASKVAAILKNEHSCDVVICLSQTDNYKMAIDSTNINLVIGGHQKGVLYSSLVLKNAQGQEVCLNQTNSDLNMVGSMKMMFNEEREGCGMVPGYVMA
ncbi:bifunctional UDP-sugar hydrolase/5'-nucleotidase [Chitinophaga tropicalis]|uniref:5'-nucleotidase n=1 Tax=Chitinophaga tropicalis TaxID=2683588 RepID=A0A7K1U0H5_9BACT|nr:hypothetical protein [Chitinophaga tropicalis]MVT07874.1 hypothetical protein [Chitinophaga tropicalis]